MLRPTKLGGLRGVLRGVEALAAQNGRLGSGVVLGWGLEGSNGKVNVLLCSDADFTERMEETPRACQFKLLGISSAFALTQ